MTCVIGLEHKGRVWMGADSAVTDDTGRISIMRTPKVFLVKDYLFGFAGSLLGTLLRHNFDPTPPPTRGLERHMHSTFLEELTEFVNTSGVKKDMKDVGLLVGVRGQLYLLDGELKIIRYKARYLCIGSGSWVADGVMYATSILNPKMPPERRLRLALRATEYHVNSVRRPWKVVHT